MDELLLSQGSGEGERARESDEEEEEEEEGGGGECVWVEEGSHRAAVPSGPHAMLPAESILFLFDGFEHEGRRVHRLLDGRQLAVLLEVDAAVGAQQDVLPAPVVPVFGVCREGREGGGGEKAVYRAVPDERERERNRGP